jgi:hypothetical protein
MNLKRWWFEKSINPTHSTSHYYQNRKNQNIGIISDLEDGVEASKTIQKYFNQADINIYQLHYSNNVPEDNHFYFGKKDLSWPGIPKGTLVNNFLERNYDICFFLVKDPTLPLEFLIRSVKCALKMGFYHKSFEQYLDFSLDINKETSNKEMIKNLMKEADQLLFRA